MPDKPPPFETLVDLLRYRAESDPERVPYLFLRDGISDEVTITHAELDRRARGVAARLQETVRPGDRVLISHHPGIEYLVAFYGCLYAGVIAVPVYPPRFSQKLERLSSVLDDARPKAALTSASILENLQPTLAEGGGFADLAWITTDTDYPADGWQRPTVTAETVAFLQYTSGSTSAPKGVMLSHGNLLANAELFSRNFRLAYGATTVSWLPQYHDMGLVGMVLGGLYIGTRLVFLSPYAFAQKPIRWLKAISRYRGNTSGAPNFAYDLCTKKITDEQLVGVDLSSWEIAFCGAEPISYEVIKAFTARFAPYGFKPEAFYPCYGMAEASLLVTGGERLRAPVARYIDVAVLEAERRAAETEPQAPGSRVYVGCGYAQPGHDVRIVDPDRGVELADGDIGEIWTCGPSISRGYWNRPEETSATFGKRLPGREGAYLRTGDLGFLRGGQLFITGRLKDMMILRGRNLYPHDIERTAAAVHPALRPGAGAAFSVEVGEEERLVVVHELERGYRDDDLESVAEAIRRSVFGDHGIEPFAVSLVKANSIPFTSSGKVQRRQTKAQFLKGMLNEKFRFEENRP